MPREIWVLTIPEAATRKLRLSTGYCSVFASQVAKCSTFFTMGVAVWHTKNLQRREIRRHALVRCVGSYIVSTSSKTTASFGARE
eukprot:Awhi_evm1s2089